MRKKNRMRLLVALALMLAAPSAAGAQGLPEFLDAVGEGMAQGVARSAAQIAASMEEEMGLTLTISDVRMENADTLTLTVRAENPRVMETPVSFALYVPQRLALSGETEWDAVLPPAQRGENGELVPGAAVFERTLALRPGGESESVQITCEMSMGPRFYRAQQTLALCVPDVSVEAELETGRENALLQPGDAFTWRILVRNAGAAAKDVPLTLVKPEAATLAGELPSGFTLVGDRVNGTVRAQAAGDESAPTLAVIELPMKISEDALEGDEDASKLLSGTLYADGERVPLPRMQVCGAKISAQLIAEEASLEEGEMTTLRVMVLNEGMAGADVALSCVLPDGLEIVQDKKAADKAAKKLGEKENKEATPGEAAAGMDGEGGAGPDGVPALAFGAAKEILGEVHGNQVMYAFYMEGARQTEEGARAATTVLELPVRAAKAQEELEEKLVGAGIAYSVDGGEMRFGEPVAMRLYARGLFGMTSEDWSGVFWAAVLMLITVSCLYGAVRAGSSREDEYFCCE